MNRGMRLFLGTLCIAALAADLLWALRMLRQDKPNPEEKRERQSKRVSRDEAGNVLVTLDREMGQRAGLAVQVLEAAALPLEQEAYGRFEEDPTLRFILRSPVAGTLLPLPDRAWPGPGERIAGGTVIGWVEPRFGPFEFIDLQVKLQAARADVEAGRSVVEASRAAYERARTLNAEEKNVSDRQLQEAWARLRADEARLSAARETVSLLEASLGGGTGSARRLPLRVERGGEVVEVLAQPGETVESGQELLRVARFDRLLARVALPAGERVPAEVAAVRIVPVGGESRPLQGTLIAVAAADAPLFGETLLLGVDCSGARLRPGIPVTAYLARPGPPRKGVVLPRPAIVRHQGKLWAYLQSGAERFARRELEGARPVENGWFVGDGFKPGEQVVVEGAQILLSEELKAGIPHEED